MVAKRFLIAPLDGGLQTNLRPWLIPDNAYAELNNMYVFRGRMRKRFGGDLIRDENSEYDTALAQLGSRVRVNIGTTDAITGNFASATPCVTGGIFKKGQLFSIGDTIFTVINDTAGNQATLTTGTATATFNVSTGDFIVTGNNENPSTAVYFYPAEPIMGIGQFNTNQAGDTPTYVFDTRFAYQYSSGAWTRLGTGVWQGDNSDFFWNASWRGSAASLSYFFVSNFQFDNASYATSDPMKYWDTSAWNDFKPQFNSTATNLIFTARVILPFKDRLILLNVVQQSAGNVLTQFGNRCRFSQNGDPTASDAWREDTGGKGGYVDAPTQETIVSAEFLRDRLIVFFEKSTWELVYTGNEVLPFRWQQINTELGVESPFSVVPFDEVVIGFGQQGIHACAGSTVRRIDDKIPDQVFNVLNENNGPVRVHGIRDYFVEQVYWAFPNSLEAPTYPNKVLVYDYKNGNWGINDDSITAFGYFTNQQDRTWESSDEYWEQALFVWGSPTLIEGFSQVLAGNQQGYLFLVDSDDTLNAPVLQITNLVQDSPVAGQVRLTIIDHNLMQNDVIYIENLNGLTGPFLPNYTVVAVQDSNTIDIDAPDIASAAGTYTGGGTATRVSQCSLTTKQYNFFNQMGINLSVDKIDILVDKTVDGEFTIDVYPSSSPDSVQSMVMETRPYNSTLYPLEEIQSRIWHSVYPNANGEVIQFKIYFSQDQLLDFDVAASDLQIHALLFYVSATSQRFE